MEPQNYWVNTSSNDIIRRFLSKAKTADRNDIEQLITFDTACRAALKQINDRNYAEKLTDDGMTTIRKYGIACYKRRCKVISG